MPTDPKPIPDPYDAPLRLRRAAELGYDPEHRDPNGYPVPTADDVVSMDAAVTRTREARALTKMSAFRDQVYSPAEPAVCSSERFNAPIPDPYA